MRTEPLTPDFYDYTWNAPDRAAIDGRFVVISWADGVELRAFDLWLRENAVGAGGVDPATREGLIDPAHLAVETRVTNATIRDDGALIVTFSPGDVQSVFHPGWLRHIADGQHMPSSWLPEQVTWTAATLPEPPTHDGAIALDDEDVLHAFANDMVRYGIARLRGLPGTPAAGERLAARLGGPRMTNFGDFWDVKTIVDQSGDPDTNSTANTNLRLGPHTDLPTREVPPGFQFLQCLVNETTGGNSTMADGAAIVAELAADYPDDYDVLTTQSWIFFNRGDGIDHRWSGPFIDLGGPASPLTLRAFYPVRAFPDMPEAEVPRAYEAMHRFSILADDAKFRLSSPFLPGDLVGFDNRRVLHGRDAYASGGARHLRGFYVDRDDVLSFTRTSNRKRSRHA